jgi:septum formation protein
MQNMPIYLASQSPRRRMLLKKMGIVFQSLKPNISEKVNTKNPKFLAVKLAQHKVMSVEQKIKKGIIIGVDTVVVINNRILGKPKNKDDARIMLNLLNGKEHRVISGIYILQKPEYHSIKTSETTKVKFRTFKKQEIDKYLDSKEPYDKAGAYGIQGKAGFFVNKINGCYFNVVGLPITKLLKCLKIIKYSG